MGTFGRAIGGGTEGIGGRRGGGKHTWSALEQQNLQHQKPRTLAHNRRKKKVRVRDGPKFKKSKHCQKTKGEHGPKGQEIEVWGLESAGTNETGIPLRKRLQGCKRNPGRNTNVDGLGDKNQNLVANFTKKTYLKKPRKKGGGTRGVSGNGRRHG